MHGLNCLDDGQMPARGGSPDGVDSPLDIEMLATDGTNIGIQEHAAIPGPQKFKTIAVRVVQQYQFSLL
jgi:hypothetical protein